MDPKEIRHGKIKNLKSKQRTNCGGGVVEGGNMFSEWNRPRTKGENPNRNHQKLILKNWDITTLENRKNREKKDER